MFLINITPWGSQWEVKQHILIHFRNVCTTEVHLLFDNPDCQEYSPKYTVTGMNKTKFPVITVALVYMKT